MITKTVEDGFTLLRGSDEIEWMVVPFWPCSAAIIRKAAPSTLPRSFVDEAAAFAQAEYDGEHS